MQARKPPGYLSGSVHLSSTVKGKPRKGGPVWEARYRLPDGKDSTKVIGPAWQKRGRPPEGHFTKVTAEVWLGAFLTKAEAAAATSGPVVPFRTVALAYLAGCERRIAAGDLRRTTFRTYRNIVAGPPLTEDGKRRKRSRDTPDVTHLIALWGDRPVGSIGEGDVEEYREMLSERGLAASTLNQHRAIVRGVFALAVARYGAPSNPASRSRGRGPDGANPTRSASTGPTRCSSSLARRRTPRIAPSSSWPPSPACASPSCARCAGAPSTTRTRSSTSSAAIPTMAGTTCRSRTASAPCRWPQVAAVLVSLREREHFTGDDDHVFANTVGGPIDGAALYRRYIKAAEDAGLRRLRFHDLRHSFGTMAVREFPITDVQVWMGHADIATTRKYVHYAPRRDAAKRLGALVGDQTPASLAIAA